MGSSGGLKPQNDSKKKKYYEMDGKEFTILYIRACLGAKVYCGHRRYSHWLMHKQNSCL